MNLWTIEDLVKIRVPMDLCISPDEKKLAYIVRVLDEDKDKYSRKLYRQNTEAKSDPVQMTQGASDEFQPAFSPDGKWLAFLSNRPVDDADGDDDDEGPSKHLYVLPLAGGEPKCLTSSLGAVYDYEFAPDGKGVFVIADAAQSEFEKQRNKALEEHKRDYTHEERVVRPRRICHVDVDSGAATTIYSRDYGLTELTVAPDGRTLVFGTNHTGLYNDFDKTNLYVLEAQSAEETPLWKVHPLVERTGMCQSPRVSPDGRHVAYIAPRNALSEISQSDIWIVPVSGSTSPVNVTEHLNFVGDAVSVDWVSTSRLLFQAEQGLYSTLFVVDGVEEVLLGGKGTSPEPITAAVVVGGSAVTRKGGLVAYTAETATVPPEVFVSTTGESPRQVTNLQAQWNDKYRAVVEDYQWQAADGSTLEGLLIRPRAGANSEPNSKGRWPLIVDIHGGPAWHTTKGFLQYINFHWLSQLGYAVFQPNYRGGLGYGQEYLQRSRGDLGGIDYHDILSGVNALIQEGVVDEQRMGVMGGSYGGYMTNWIIGHDQRFKAAVSEFGIWNLFTDFGCSGQRCWEVTYLQRYWEEEALYLERSPARYIADIQTPTLIIHGDADDNTFIANSKEMYNALLEAGKQVEFIHYPREGHGLEEPRHKADELQRIEAWFSHFIPTGETKQPTKLLQWGRISPDIQARVLGAPVVTSEFAGLDESFASVLKVEVELEAVAQLHDASGSSESVPHAVSAKEKLSTVTIGDPDENTVLLKWSGTEPYQRPSVIGPTEIVTLGWTSSDLGLVVTGKQALYITKCAKIAFLFPSEWMEYGELSETVLQIRDETFKVTAETK